MTTFLSSPQLQMSYTLDKNLGLGKVVIFLKC